MWSGSRNGAKPSPERNRRSARSRYETERVSERLRELRLGRKLTISRLAELSKVPASTISKIENGQLRPSLVHAINLASALQENLGFLVARFRERPQPRVVVRRSRAGHDRISGHGTDLAGLVRPLSARRPRSAVGHSGRGAHSGVGSMTHRGEEFCFVLSGAITYRIDEETYDLAADEYLHFRSDIPHSWENAVADETQGPLGILRRTFFLIEETMHKVSVRQEIIDRVLAGAGVIIGSRNSILGGRRWSSSICRNCSARPERRRRCRGRARSSSRSTR